jgi:DNA-binding NtrC family response regulator
MLAARRKVLKMLHESKLTVDEAEDLLDTIEKPQKSHSPTIPKPEYIGDSEWAQQFRKILDKMAATEAPVLVQGEPGTGKGIVARAIHYNSKRVNGPFTILSCDPSAPTIDSELFGHEEGAFTGAIRPKKGLLDVSNGGTLVLGPLEDFPLETQHRLLSFLESGHYTRIGGTKPLYADVRIIGLTEQDLKQRIDQGKFRSDLFYRLSVCMVQVAPLREHREDIPVLTAYFVANQAEKDTRERPKVSPEVAKILYEYDWPNNVRELWHVISKAVVLCDGDEITPEQLPALGL